MKRAGLVALVTVAAFLPALYAPPPLITGDVPTADKGHFELYTGGRYQDTGRIQRQLPHAELVYGVAIVAARICASTSGSNSNSLRPRKRRFRHEMDYALKSES